MHVPQRGLRHHRTDRSGKGGNHARGEQAAEACDQQGCQRCQAVQQQAGKQCRAAAPEVAQPTPDQHANGKGGEVQRQGLRRLRRRYPEALADIHQGGAVEGFGDLREHQQGRGQGQPGAVGHK
ncbi:hypothetical protein D3C76_1052300 [compost metagenome]